MGVPGQVQVQDPKQIIQNALQTLAIANAIEARQKAIKDIAANLPKVPKDQWRGVYLALNPGQLNLIRIKTPSAELKGNITNFVENNTFIMDRHSQTTGTWVPKQTEPAQVQEEQIITFRKTGPVATLSIPLNNENVKGFEISVTNDGDLYGYIYPKVGKPIELNDTQARQAFAALGGDARGVITEVSFLRFQNTKLTNNQIYRFTHPE